MTYLEFNILHLLANYPDRAWSRQQIIEKIWGWNCNNPGDEQIVSVHIAQIRKKLSQVDAAAAQLIKTVRNYGYRFDRPPICENTLNQNVS
ncbi:MAG: winged helix-turn-helix domain-containing protein [Oscillatoriales cyanobacterium RU_3_3]|nr:winged helix-turn-helix domain-containing protein [Microcoleus sp. SU_5_6]NJL66311.1 winged helix-turn-helix domain-containing protein [Microcoleus sp. SM1_3_4]NJM63259.1 winged helix-turn-helix domain-containing protein [Oscillatoriales cyanobacterium RU_3_3]NJR24298.1 winged helix-turn-helix domain-containing protein [Richelia sp. CSU_2_1]